MNNQLLSKCPCIYESFVVPDKLTNCFAKRMNLLIVDDSEMVITCLEGFFSTPFINVSTATTVDSAFKLISTPSRQWHCWIIDMNLGNRLNEGLDIIEQNKSFPFSIIFSGIGSMETAAQAMELGAAEIIDKTHDAINKLILKTCRLMPISMLCKGRLQKNRSVFFLLKENIIKDCHEWAYAANLSLRQLQNICTLYTGMSPSYVLPMYYGMQQLLVSSFKQFKHPSEYFENESFFYACLDFIDQNLPYYQTYYHICL